MPSFVEVHRAKGASRAYFQPASEHQKKTYLDLVKQGMNPGEARKKTKLTWALFKHALADDPAFREAHEDIDEYFLDRLEALAWDAARKGDGAMMRFLLVSGRPEKYGPKAAKVQLTHRFESIEDLKAMSDDDLIAQCELLGIEAKP